MCVLNGFQYSINILDPEPVVKHGFENSLYVYSAYRVLDEEIRIAIVKSHRSR